MGSGKIANVISFKIFFYIKKTLCTLGLSLGSKKHFKPLILMAKDIETVAELTNKSQDKVVIMYETFKDNFPRGSLYKRQKII